LGFYNKLTFTNSLGKSLTFYANAGVSFILRSIDGLGGLDTDIQTEKGPFQNGSTFISLTLSDRPITIDADIRGKNADEIHEKRMLISEIFNPLLGPGELIYENASSKKRITALCDTSPTFPIGKSNRTTSHQRTSITLICHDPFWTDVYDNETELKAFEEAFTFPFEFPVTFGQQGAEVTFYNDGHAETPMLIQLNGPSYVPRIENVKTGDYLQLNHNIKDNEILEISTRKGNKYAEIIKSDGTRENVFGELDYRSVFFSLQQGENHIRYYALTGEGSATAVIKWKRQYIGI
jgi:hypothetical protein